MLFWKFKQIFTPELRLGSDFVGSNPAEFFVEVQGDQFEVTDLGGM